MDGTLLNNTIISTTVELSTTISATIESTNVTNITQIISQVADLRSLKLIELVSLAVIGVLILLGNALVILAFMRGPRRIRTLTNYFVVNLAVSDLLVGCLSLPFWFCVLLGITSPSVEKFFIALDILFGTTSILSLAAISVERMFAVKYPAQHFNLSRRPVVTSIVLTWVIGIIITITNTTLNDLDLKASTTAIFIIAFVLPLNIIVASYIILFAVAYNLTKADNQNNSITREIQIAKTISVIIGLFIICWAPFFVVNVVYVYCPTCSNSWVVVVSVTKILHYSNSMMNFFVYAVRSPDFRETFKALLFNKCSTKGVRERLRSVSFHSIRTRTSSTLKRYSHNSDVGDEKCENFINKSYKPSQKNNGDTKVPRDGSGSPTISFLIYEYQP